MGIIIKILKNSENKINKIRVLFSIKMRGVVRTHISLRKKRGENRQTIEERSAK